MNMRVLLFMTILIISVSFSFAHNSDQDPLVGTWTCTYPNGKKKVIRVSKYGDNYLLKKKTIWTDGTTTYNNITVTYSSSNLIKYYDYVEEWDNDGNCWNNLTYYYSFQFDNGRASDHYVRFEYKCVYINNNKKEGGFDMDEYDYYYMDDPDW